MCPYKSRVFHADFLSVGELTGMSIGYVIPITDNQ